MSKNQIIARPLTREAFRAFGDVIEIDGAEHFTINNGTTERYHDLAGVDVTSNDGHPMISIFVGQPFVPPVEIRMMERHPLGSQAFMPLDRRPYLVAVALSDGQDRPGEPAIFLATGDQGVNYARNTWHHPLISLEAESRFLIVDRGGAGENLHEINYDGAGYLAALG
jgi:ureidoglycolate lyase